jgi:hypothetical protein
MDRFELPAAITVPQVEGATVTVPGRLLLSQLFTESESAIRDAVMVNGYYDNKETGKRLYVQTQAIEGNSRDRSVVAIAAVARDPGLTQTRLDTIQDYLPRVGNRTQQLRQYRRIAQTEGLVHNAISKIAAILSGGGRYKVRNAKKGKARKATEQLQTVVDEFSRNVNNSPLDGVVTGDRGLQMVTQQAVRVALIDGDWCGRTNWMTHTIGSEGTFSLPMGIQTIPMDQLEPVKELAGTGIELFTWKPPSTLIDQIKNPSSKEVKNAISKFISKDVAKQLLAGGTAILDPALLMHIKHRGIGSEVLGESFIEPLKKALAYKNSVESLDLVTMESIINRITIVMVGSSDPKSPYSVPDIALARTNLMQSFFTDSGPNMTIIWQGDDVEVKSVGAYDQVLQLDDRHRLADGKLKDGMGVADALLRGTSDDGKSAGWAAVLGTSAELIELQVGFANGWTSIGERIALENNFTDIDLVFEFDNQLMSDRNEERTQNRNDYISGGFTIRDWVAGMGKDPDAVFQQKCFEKGLDPNTTTWEAAFMPPQGLQGQGTTPGAPGDGTAPAGAPPRGQGPGKVPGNGRPAGTQNDPTAPAPAPTPTENK